MEHFVQFQDDDAPSSVAWPVVIFMASHGPRSIGGVMLGSETLKVLAQTRIPVLVSSVERNDPST